MHNNVVRQSLTGVDPNCTRSPKSVRAKYVFEAIYELLDKLELTDEAYERYSKRIDGFTDAKIIKIKQDIASKRGANAHKKKELEELSLGLGKINRSLPAYAINESRINQLANETLELDEAIDKLKEKIANPSKIKLTKEQFLNLTIDNEKRLSVIWKEPFASLVTAIETTSGGDERT